MTKGHHITGLGPILKKINLPHTCALELWQRWESRYRNRPNDQQAWQRARYWGNVYMRRLDRYLADG